MLIGENFEIQTSSYEEEHFDLKPKELVLHHSLEKGRDVAQKSNEGVVISADTVVFFEVLEYLE